MKKTKTIVLVLLLALLPASCKKEEITFLQNQSPLMNLMLLMCLMPSMATLPLLFYTIVKK